jgi:spermidine synthase
VLMGATLPVLSRADLVRASGARLGTLYAVNTTGALAGALLTGYVLIGGIGIQRTFYLAAALNLAVAGVAWWLSRHDPLPVVEGSGTGSEKFVPGDAVPATVVLSAMAVSGVASLALEIVWFRILVQFLPATSYAFTTMLATVLAGIAIGSALASRALTRPRNWSVVLAATLGATSIVVLTSLAILGVTYAAGWRTSGLAQGSAAAILPAAILMGYAFPIALALWTRPRDADVTTRPREVGTMYAANVIGGIAGAVLGGFVLLPWLGSRRALIACAALYLAASVVMFARLRRPLVAVALVVLFAASARVVPDPFDAALARRHGRGERIFWKEEGVQTSVSIHTHAFRGWLMYLDGLHQASDAPEMVRLHRLIGHLPMVLHPKPDRALVVGLGCGATPGAVSQHDSDVLVVELSDTVRKGAAFFKHVNYDLFARPNVTVRVDDGRNFLSLTDATFDVVTADLIQPIHAGAGNLYSREYFQLVADALADDGLVLQWIGHRPDSQYRLIMRTFLDVFPYTTLWADGQLMVGAKRPLRLARAAFDAKRDRAVTRAALDEVGLDSFETLTSWYVAGPDELRRFVGAGPLLSDDRPLVEYHRSLPAGEPMVDLRGLRGDVAEILER